jgi:DNA-binding transcriptional LysR family regulator
MTKMKNRVNRAARNAIELALFERDRTVGLTPEGRRWLRAAKAREMRATKPARGQQAALAAER